MNVLPLQWSSLPCSSILKRGINLLVWISAHVALAGLRAETLPPKTSPTQTHSQTLQILSKKISNSNKTLDAEGSSNVAGPPLSQNLMIYRSGRGVVTDVRTVDLKAGHNILKIDSIAAQFRTETLLVRDVDEKASMIVTECSFDAAPLTFSNILEKSVGKMVYVLPEAESLQKGNRTEGLTGRLLAIDHSKVLVDIDGQIQTVPLEKIAFRKIPASLSVFPILCLGIQSPCSRQSTLELTYITKGLSWEAYYTLEISPHTQTANMMGWIAIQNTSGTNFTNAHVQFATSPSGPVSAPLTPLATQSALDPIPTPISLYDGAVKKVSFFSAYKVHFSKEHHLELPPLSLKREEASKPLEVKVWCALKHTFQRGQNFPIPEGPVRVYLKTPSHTQNAGRFFIPYTNVGETFSVPLEKCTSITAQIQQLSLRPQTGESAFLVLVTNKNTKSVVVQIMQKLPPNTSLLSSSVDSYKLGEETIQWSVEVPANESVSLRYRTRFDQNTATNRKA